MDYVQPSFAENVCDSTREEEIVVFCGIAISAIFVKKVTRLVLVWKMTLQLFGGFLNLWKH